MNLLQENWHRPRVRKRTCGDRGRPRAHRRVCLELGIHDPMAARRKADLDEAAQGDMRDFAKDVRMLQRKARVREGLH